jgi:hypothetical protein
MRIPRQHVSKGLRAFSPFWAGSPASYQCAHEQGLAQGSNLGLEHRADGVHSRAWKARSPRTRSKRCTSRFRNALTMPARFEKRTLSFASRERKRKPSGRDSTAPDSRASLKLAVAFPVQIPNDQCVRQQSS